MRGWGGGDEDVLEPDSDDRAVTCECPKTLGIIYFTVFKMVTFIHLNTKLMKRSIQSSLKFSIHAHFNDPPGPHLGPCHGVFAWPSPISWVSGAGGGGRVVGGKGRGWGGFLVTGALWLS